MSGQKSTCETKQTKSGPKTDVDQIVSKWEHGKNPVVKIYPAKNTDRSLAEELSDVGKIPKLPTLAEWGNDMSLYLSALMIYEKYHGEDVEGAIRRVRSSGPSSAPYKLRLKLHIRTGDEDPVYGAYRARYENGQSPVGSPIKSPM